MLDLYKNIKKLREEQNLSQEELAKLTGYTSRSSIAKIEKGEVDLQQSKIIAFAKALHTTTSLLMGNEDLALSMSKPKQKHKGVKIPVYGRVAAGVPLEMIDDILDTEEITEDLSKTGEFFGLQIKGDSMEPRIVEGDVVIVRQQADADTGDIIIATVNGTDATCKRLKKYADGIALIALNPAYEPMIFSKKEVAEKPVRIIGKVVELRGKF